MNLVIDLKRYLLQFLEVPDLLSLSVVSREWNRLCREPSVWYPKLANPSLSKELGWHLYYAKSMMKKRGDLSFNHLPLIAEISRDLRLWGLDLFEVSRSYYFSTSEGYTINLFYMNISSWVVICRADLHPEVELVFELLEINWPKLRPLILKIEEVFILSRKEERKEEKKEKEELVPLWEDFLVDQILNNISKTSFLNLEYINTRYHRRCEKIYLLEIRYRYKRI